MILRAIIHGIATVAVFSYPVYRVAYNGSVPATAGLIILACILYVFSLEVSHDE